MIEGLTPTVTLDHGPHKYFHDVTGEEYMSVSKFFSLFKKPFDKSIAYNCAGKGDYVGMTAEEVLNHWEVYGKERADVGTRVHNSLELFSNTTTILPENHDLRPAILNIASQYKGYYRQYNEVVLSDDEFKIAGTSDKVFLVNSNKDSPIDIGDYKSNLKGIHQVDLDKKGQPVHKWMLHCLDWLVDSKYNGYALQLSVYGYMVEKLTGKKIRKLFIHYINPDNPLINYQIPLPYMRLEVQAMFEWKWKNYDVKKIEEKVESKASAIKGFGNSTFLSEAKVQGKFDIM